MEDMARRAPFGDDGRVQLGFFFDSYSLSREIITDLFGQM
jgi:hypothetical protein